MQIHKIVDFLEEYKNKSLDDLVSLAKIFEDDPFSSDEEVKLYEYLAKFLKPFFIFRNTKEIADKEIFEQLALFYESEAVKKPLAAAVCWLHYFNDALEHHEHALGYIALAENLFYEPNRFFGFLGCLINKNVAPRDILQTNIVHQFFQYNYDSLEADDSPIRQFLLLFEGISDVKIKSFLNEIVKSEIMIRKQLAISMVQNSDKKWQFKLVPSTTVRFDYRLPPFQHDRVAEHGAALYRCFQMDFIKLLDVSDARDALFMGSLLVSLIKSGANRDLDALFSYALAKLKIDHVRLFLSQIVDFLHTIIDEEGVPAKLVKQNPNFIFAMLYGFSEHRHSMLELQIVLNAGNMREFIATREMTLGLRHILILSKYIAASKNVNTDVFFAIFDVLKKIILENKHKEQTDTELYGVSFKFLTMLARLPGVHDAVTSYVEEINAPVFEKIKKGDDFDSICAQWQLPVLNVFKRFCPALFLEANALGSTNAIKVAILENKWNDTVKLAEGYSTAAEELFSFGRVFALFGKPAGDNFVVIDRDEEVRILRETLIDTKELRLRRACINHFILKLNMPDWADKILSDKLLLEHVINLGNKALLKEMKLDSSGYLRVFSAAFKMSSDVSAMASYCFQKIDLSKILATQIIKLLSLVLSRHAFTYEKRIFDVLGVEPRFALALIGGSLTQSIQNYSDTPLADHAAAVLLGVIMLQALPAAGDRHHSIRYLTSIINNYDAFAFAFNVSPKTSIDRRTLINAIIDKQLMPEPRFFAVENAGFWWNDRVCDNFYIACAFEVINRRYFGSRREALQALLASNDSWFQKVKTFLEEGRSTQKSSRLNKALTVLMMQVEGKCPVSMTAISEHLNPAPGPDEVRAFSYEAQGM